MFKLFKRNKQVHIIDKKMGYNKPNMDTLFKFFVDNNFTKLEILKDIKLIDFCNFSCELEKNVSLGIKDLNLRCVITKGSCTFQDEIMPQQNIYMFRFNNKDYTISTSLDMIKISERELIEKNTYEYTLNIDFNKDKYTIGKYIHNKFKSTFYDKWYPNGLIILDEEKALEITKALLSNLESIENIHDILDINNIYFFMNNHTNWNLRRNSHQKVLKYNMEDNCNE